MPAGLIGYVAVGVESSAGDSSRSFQAPVAYVPFLSENLAVVPNPITAQGIHARWDPTKVYNGLQRVEGTIAVEVHPTTIGWFLRSWFDACTITLANSLGSHRFAARNEQFQSGSASNVPTLTFEIYRGPQQHTAAAPSSAFQYAHCAANVMEITAEAGGLVRASFDYLGREYNRVAASTASFPTADTFMWSSISLSIGGTGNTIFETITVRGNNNLEAVPKLDGRLRPDLIERNNFRDIEINGRLSFQRDTEYDDFRNGSETSLKLHFVAQQNNSFTLTIDAPAFRYRTFPLGIGGPGRIAVDFTGNAVYLPSSGTPLEITVVNTKWTSYQTNSLT